MRHCSLAFGTPAALFAVLALSCALFITSANIAAAQQQTADPACITETQNELRDRAGEVFNSIDEATQTTIANFICTAGVDLDALSDTEIQGMLFEAGILAQNAPASGGVGETGGNAQLASCFNYYSFGSVVPHLSTELEQVVSGTTIHVKGTVENTNPYPIVEGTLYVKVFKKRGDGTQKDPNGPDVVDQFVAVDDISIDAESSVPVAFTWDVPAYAQSGDYEIATFFTTSKRYNLLGLAFTDDVVGTTVRFSVAGEHDTGTAFQKDSVTVNERDYFFAAYPPRFATETPIAVQATLENTADRAVTVPVTFELYRWDQQRRENILDTQTQQVRVGADGVTDVAYAIRDTEHPVYLLVVTAEYGDTKSILNVRVVRNGVAGARINFPSLTAFPLERGTQHTVFACMHSMSDQTTPDSEVVVTLTDRLGNEIHSANYVGNITGAMMGMASAFTPRRDHDYVNLTAQLFTGGTLIEAVELTYDCEDINPAFCGDEAETQLFDFTDGTTLIGLGVVVFVLFGLGYILTRRSDVDNGFT